MLLPTSALHSAALPVASCCRLLGRCCRLGTAADALPLTAALALQVLDLLVKLYKFPNFSISRALLHGTSAPSATPAPSPNASQRSPRSPAAGKSKAALATAASASSASSTGPDLAIGELG